MIDLTSKAVERQLRSMLSVVHHNFEVGIGPAFNRSGSPILKDNGEPVFFIKEWDCIEVISKVQWLKAQNRCGANIFIRPVGSTGLLLLDDVTITQLNRMEADGLIPSCVVETSPLNYQAWLRVAPSPIDSSLATATAQFLAEKYQADSNSADWRHFGRLAGFTNRKPKHVDETGKYPFVLLRQTKRNQVHEHLLEKGSTYLEIKQAKKKRSSFPVQNIGHPSPTPLIDPKEYFCQVLERLKKACSNDLDLSRADWTIARDMIAKGYGTDDIRYAMEQCSPDIHTRKSGHLDDYLDRTISNASITIQDRF